MQTNSIVQELPCHNMKYDYNHQIKLLASLYLIFEIATGILYTPQCQKQSSQIMILPEPGLIHWGRDKIVDILK